MLRFAPVVAVLILVAVPMAHAQSEAEVEVVFDKTVGLPGTPNKVTYPTGQGGADGCSVRGTIVPTPGGRGFRFQEPDREAGCAEASFFVNIPPGAQTAQVHFTADRKVTHSGVGDIGIAMRQAIKVGEGEFKPVFQTHSRSHDATPHEVAYSLQGDAPLQITWLFSDDGRTENAPASLPSTGNKLEATVSRASVVFPNIAVETHSDSESYVVDALSTLTRTRIHFQIPAGLDDVDVRLLTNGARIVALFGPAGDVTGQIMASQVPGWVVLPGAGAGEYEVVLESTSPRPVVFLAGLPALAMATPAVAGIGATASLVAWRRGAHHSQTSSFQRTRIALVGLGLLLVAYAVFAWRSGARAMGMTPTSAEGWLGFGMAGLLTLALAGLIAQGLVQRRQALERSHRDVLQRTNRQLERSNRDLGNFAAVASHDLKAPLRRVVSLTQLLQRRLGPKADADVEELLRMAIENGSHMQRLIEDLLAYSRLDQRTAHGVVSLQEVLEGVEFDVGPDVAACGGSLEVRVNGAVVGTKSLLRELFGNLLANAVRYRRPDVPLAVRVRAKVVGGDVVVTVRDNGQGIPEAQQKRIFNMFERAHEQQEGDPGTGIGLATCLRIAELHDGSISVDSSPGEGATFTVRLPAAS